MSKVLLAGSFNPFTVGHKSVYDEACAIFGEKNVYIAVTQNALKDDMNRERLKWITNPVLNSLDSKRIIVVDDKVLAEYAKKHNFDALVRSMRNSIDLVNEVNLATWNKTLGISTVFVPSDSALNHISSSAIRELDFLDIDVSKHLVNEIQYKRWKNGQPTRIIVTGHMGAGKSSFIKDYSKIMCNRHEAVDMDLIMKGQLSEESQEIFKNFFETTEVQHINSQWFKSHLVNDKLTEAKKEVERIVYDSVQRSPFGNTTLFEMSAFTSYNLDYLYESSIIVYVQNYTNGKARTIDSQMMLKFSQLQQPPKVVDFVIDQIGDIDETVMQIRRCFLNEHQ